MFVPNMDKLKKFKSAHLQTKSNYNNNIPRLFPSLRWGTHALGILTFFTELTIEMNSVGPVMAS